MEKLDKKHLLPSMWRVQQVLLGLTVVIVICLLTFRIDVWQGPTYMSDLLEVKSQEEAKNCWNSPYVICEGTTNTRMKLDNTYTQKYGTFLPVKYTTADILSKKPAGLNINGRFHWNGSKPVSEKTVIKVALYNKAKYILPLNFSSCEYRNCQYVGTKIDESTDVVVVLGVGLTEKVAPQRWPHHLYAMVGWESPVHFNSAVRRGDKNNKWSRAFNITVTYRRDADVFRPYMRIKPDPTQLQGINLTEFALNKTKTALWIASNCGSAKRKEFVKELQKHIDVDIYGGCGKPCNKSLWRDPCVATEPYRFYLSFENSLCEDYVTEKLFKVFSPEYPMVPVVRGGSDYASFFPPKSFIDAGNFTSAKNLAHFMKHLSRKENIHEYVDYLKSKMMYTRVQSINDYHCGLCEYLNKLDRSVEKVYDMPTWMGGCNGNYL